MSKILIAMKHTYFLLFFVFYYAFKNAQKDVSSNTSTGHQKNKTTKQFQNKMSYVSF